MRPQETHLLNGLKEGDPVVFKMIYKLYYTDPVIISSNSISEWEYREANSGGFRGLMSNSITKAELS